MKNILSIDVEDWFHIMDLPSTPPLHEWDHLESRVERNFFILLDLMDRFQVHATCFFLGWIAKRYPALVKEAAARGHEIAAHGFGHILVYTQTREEFSEDITKTRKILEDISGQSVTGFRAPGFSIQGDTPWALEEIARAGYLYDASIFPAVRGHGGIPGGKLFPHEVKTPSGNIMEFPVSVLQCAGKRICFFGGGYLRLFPYVLIRSMAKRVNREGRPVIYYVHPREIDPSHPRLSMPMTRRFKSYINLGSTLPKISRLMKDSHLTSFREWMDNSKN